jgi:hypothetical protein
LRALKAAMDRLPPPKPVVPVAPFDPLDRICSPGQWQWARDMVKANREAGVDAAMRAELADRMRPREPPKLGPGPAAEAGGSGWAPVIPLEPPPGIREVDRLCDAQDAVDRAELRKRLGGG